MKKWCLAGLLFLSGCTTVSTTFRCVEASCQPYDKASGQCLAEAKSLHTDHNRKKLIFRQCMTERGYKEYKCDPVQIYENPCQSFYVY